MAAHPLADTDSEEELPPDWEELTTSEGWVYYANHSAQCTQWSHPVTGRRKCVPGELPFGWSTSRDPDGSVCYTDSINNKTTYTDPRLAYAVESRGDDGQVLQRFDCNSTAAQVLQGRDLSGRVALVTGATGGIGGEVVRSLVSHGCRVVLAARDLSKCRRCIADIKRKHPFAQLSSLHLDLSSLHSVYQCATDFLAMGLPLNMLILNAGIFGVPYEITQDSLEKTFQVNYLSGFYLVQLLTDKLVANEPSRVVCVSSESHRFVNPDGGRLSLDESLFAPSYNEYWPVLAHNRSKLCLILLTNELNKKLSKKGVTCNSCHPGNMVYTKLPNNWWLYKFLFLLVRPFTKSVAQAAATPVFCATALELRGYGGLYFSNCCCAQPDPEAISSDRGAQLWELSLELLRERNLPTKVNLDKGRGGSD